MNVDYSQLAIPYIVEMFVEAFETLDRCGTEYVRENGPYCAFNMAFYIVHDYVYDALHDGSIDSETFNQITEDMSRSLDNYHAHMSELRRYRLGVEHEQ